MQRPGIYASQKSVRRPESFGVRLAPGTAAHHEAHTSAAPVQRTRNVAGDLLFTSLKIVFVFVAAEIKGRCFGTRIGVQNGSGAGRADILFP